MPKDDENPQPPRTGDPLVDHVLPPSEDKATVAMLRRRLPYYGSPEVESLQLASAYADLANVALARAKFYGELLTKQVNDEGIGGLIGHKYAGTADKDGGVEIYAQSEEVRALVALEAAERDRAATLIEKGVRLGLEQKHVDAMRAYGRTVGEALKAYSEELGVIWGEPLTRRAAQRAILTARERLGFDYRPASTVGPALSEAERERVRNGE